MFPGNIKSLRIVAYLRIIVIYKYFFTEVDKNSVGLLYNKSVSMLKEYNISQHYVTNHADYGKIDEDLKSQLARHVPSFQLFPLALDESTESYDTAGFLNTSRGISRNLEITE
ncbi:hypothetical protein RF11_08354 [Thelohanellus kitauei]|uniref:Uncharacterized protein n=1 Tax=Thelohanellus kitauei TaxID=669202 RepID=A0A0C2MLD5_THEKT|nr:hypothetical protein RF11_08354 [Thelohanellus kitauei]